MQQMNQSITAAQRIGEDLLGEGLHTRSGDGTFDHSAEIVFRWHVLFQNESNEDDSGSIPIWKSYRRKCLFATLYCLSLILTTVL